MMSYAIPRMGSARISTKLRRAIALPIYTVALILSYASDAPGDPAALIAGDVGARWTRWPGS